MLSVVSSGELAPAARFPRLAWQVAADLGGSSFGQVPGQIPRLIVTLYVTLELRNRPQTLGKYSKDNGGGGGNRTRALFYAEEGVPDVLAKY